MRLVPRRSQDYVVYAEEMRVRIYEAREWKGHRADGQPVIDIDGDEALALAEFVTRWAEEWGADLPAGASRDVEYDY